MLINKKITLCTIIEHDFPITQSLLYMDEFGVDSVKLSKFENLLKAEIDRLQTIHKESSIKKTLIEKVKKVYSITNLKKNNIIIVDDGDNSLSFVSHIHDMFSDLRDSMKVRPITNREFVNHLKYLSGLASDSSEFHSYSEIDKEKYLEDVQTFLRRVKQDLDKNRKVIIARAENLSRYFENDHDTTINKNKVMQEIIVLCEKYVEPFYQFLENFRDDSFLYQMSRFKKFFVDNDLPEEDQISRFIINFASYKKDIRNVYDKINDYRRKGQKDLVVYNAFEKEFNLLNEAVLALQDGKQTRNHIEASEYSKRYTRFDKLKVNNTYRSDIAIDYSNLTDRFLKIEEQLLMDLDLNSTEEMTTEEIWDIESEESLEEVKERELRHEIDQFHVNLEMKIHKAISRNHKYLSRPDIIDLQQKVNNVLSQNINDYRLSHAVYGYLVARETVKNIRVGFNERARLIIGNQSYQYRPVYVVGQE